MKIVSLYLPFLENFKMKQPLFADTRDTFCLFGMRLTLIQGKETIIRSNKAKGDWNPEYTSYVYLALFGAHVYCILNFWASTFLEQGHTLCLACLAYLSLVSLHSRHPKARERGKMNAWIATRSNAEGSRSNSLAHFDFPPSISTACHTA